jgi:hypothetical protein
MRSTACLVVVAALIASLPAGAKVASAAPHRDWTRYHAFGGGIQFSYPADLLSISGDSTALFISHSVPYRHVDPCDFESEGWLDALTDFKLDLTWDPHGVVER